jgi:hypothetical protein
LRSIIKGRDEKEEDEHLDNWLIELWIFNTQEQNVNAFFHKAVLDKYLTICGYTVDKFEGEGDYVDDDTVEIEEDEYEKIKDLDMDEFKNVDTLIKRGDASQNQKKEHKFFIFNEFVLPDRDHIDNVIISGMFDVYTKNTNKIKDAMVNMDLELRYVYNENMKTKISIYKDNKKEKLESLKEIKNQLGVRYTFDKDVVLSKDTLSKAGEYLEANLEVLKAEWGLDLREFKKKNTWTEKTCLGILNQIWTRWGFNEIKRGKQEKKQINGVRVDVSCFNIKPVDIYKEFDEHCFDRTEYTDDPEY